MRRRVEVLLRHGQIAEAVALMSEHERSDFPPHWEPPPRVGYGETEPALVDALEALDSGSTPRWVQALFLDKLARMVQDPYEGLLNYLSPDGLDRYLSIIETLPEGLELVRKHPESFEQILGRDDRSDSQHERVRVLLEASGHPVETVEDALE
jgi:hypothetical protein